jgi:hypothetical protein
VSVRARPVLLAALALLAGLGAASAQGQGGRRDRDEEFRRADPAAVIAAELAFARAAQEKGQWTAFAEYATRDAVMFVPQPVIAQDWLKGRANPPQAVRWQPHQVWSSCDGTLAVTRGAWQRPDGSVGYFTTVWQRQGKRGKTEYRWVMDQGDALAEPLAASEMIEAKVADCTPQPAGYNELADLEANADAAGLSVGGGASRDGSLLWQYWVAPSGARETVVYLAIDGELTEVMRSEVAAE